MIHSSISTNGTQIEHPLRDVYVLNNQGCLHLRDGHHALAMNCFKTALTNVKDMLAVHGGAGSEGLYSHQLLPMPSHVLRSHLPTGIWDCNNLRTKTGGSTHNYFTFTDGIPCFPGPSFSIHLIEEAKVVSAIIMFNLGLTTHFGALDNGCHRELKKALSLYLFTARLLGPILDDHRHGERPTGNAAFDLLAIALYNNMAVAHSECQEFGDAEEAFRRLALFSYSSTSFSSETIQSRQTGLEQHDDVALRRKINGMLMNATIGGFFPPLAAPAA
jgi:hypothetical protein